MNLMKKTIKPCVIWFTGYSGAGKSSLAIEVEKQLLARGVKTSILDGDIVRAGLSKDLSFSQDDREENIRRVGHMAHQLVDAGIVVLCAFISPFRESRAKVRGLFNEGEFIEVFVDTPLEVCEQRDVKGLYQKARTGEITDFTGIGSPYEKPLKAEIHLAPSLAMQSTATSAQQVMAYLQLSQNI